MKLIVEPADGVAPLLSAIGRAKKSVEIAIFRLDYRDVELALTAAAARGVKVTALIAFSNRGGERKLRQLEMRFLAAGIAVSRTADDLARYHGKYILIDRRVLYVLSFNFTRLDIDHSRGFGIVTSRTNCLQEAAKLFEADCTRTRYAPVRGVRREPGELPPRPGHVPETSDEAAPDLRPEDLGQGDAGILHARAKAGVEIRVIGQVSGRPPFDVRSSRGRGFTRARSSATEAGVRRKPELAGRRTGSASRGRPRRPGTESREDADRHVRVRLDTDGRRGPPGAEDVVDVGDRGPSRRVRRGDREGGRRLHPGNCSRSP